MSHQIDEPTGYSKLCAELQTETSLTKASAILAKIDDILRSYTQKLTERERYAIASNLSLKATGKRRLREDCIVERSENT